jgi:BlaI family transcriptional regulator, penicillinase repressor
MTRNPDEQPDLSPAQAEIMRLIWQHGAISASALTKLVSRRRPVARNTVRTLLERMENKGWITHRVEGRTFLYFPAQPKQKTIGQRVRKFVETFCGGSAETLVTALLDVRGLSADELRRIRALLDRTQATLPRKRSPR